MPIPYTCLSKRKIVHGRNGGRSPGRLFGDRSSFLLLRRTARSGPSNPYATSKGAPSTGVPRLIVSSGAPWSGRVRQWRALSWSRARPSSSRQDAEGRGYMGQSTSPMLRAGRDESQAKPVSRTCFITFVLVYSRWEHVGVVLWPAKALRALARTCSRPSGRWRLCAKNTAPTAFSSALP